MDSILGDESLEGEQFKTLNQDVTQTVFAVAYGIESKGGWPTSPVKLEQIYKGKILPPLASKKEVSAYRNAWGKWMEQEARLLEAKSKASDKGERSAAFERFLAEKRPQMLWDLEKDIFGMGDEKMAALAMLKHLQTFLGHKNEVQWTKDFLAFLEPVQVELDEAPAQE